MRGLVISVFTVAGALAATSLPASGMAHPGGLNAEGCHNNRRTGDYHCHRRASSRPSTATAARARGGAYPNCAAARAAGAAPVHRGEPGYGPHLDRDGDGVGCER